MIAAVWVGFGCGLFLGSMMGVAALGLMMLMKRRG